VEIIAETIRPARPGRRNRSAKNLSMANLAVVIAFTSSQSFRPDFQAGSRENAGELLFLAKV
jgi:hypothetical protein